MSDRTPAFLPKASLQRLIDALAGRGYRVMAPVVSDGAAQWGPVTRVSELAAGMVDSQDPGRYRVEPTTSSDIFSLVHGPQALKPFTFAPREPLLSIERRGRDQAVHVTEPRGERLAFLGVRACDLAGVRIQDHIFLQGPYGDPYYRARRDGLFMVVVNCTRALPVCFCASMGTGPRAHEGYDLALTELDDGFVVEAGSDAGHAVARDLALPAAPDAMMHEGDRKIAACASSQTRRVEGAALPQGLYAAQDHPRWDEVASRCLACGNCTMVCPTCFCHGAEDTPDLTGQRSERARVWDSCFTQEHGYIHGKNLRPAIKDRYRMWMTHKWASWIDQFGMSGCVGCGRCLTWCPVGIDPTEELAALMTPRPDASTQEP